MREFNELSTEGKITRILNEGVGKAINEGYLRAFQDIQHEMIMFEHSSITTTPESRWEKMSEKVSNVIEALKTRSKENGEEHG